MTLFLDQCAFQRSDINTVYQPEGLFMDFFYVLLCRLLNVLIGDWAWHKSSWNRSYHHVVFAAVNYSLALF